MKKHTFSILFLGSSGCGKTSLAKALAGIEWGGVAPSTACLDFSSITHSVRGNLYNFHIYDTCGDEHFAPIYQELMRKSQMDLVLLCLDLTNKQAIRDSAVWINFTKIIQPEHIVYIGTKLDLGQLLEPKAIKGLVGQNQFYSVSARVKNQFAQVFEEILHNFISSKQVLKKIDRCHYNNLNSYPGTFEHQKYIIAIRNRIKKQQNTKENTQLCGMMY